MSTYKEVIEKFPEPGKVIKFRNRSYTLHTEEKQFSLFRLVFDGNACKGEARLVTVREDNSAIFYPTYISIVDSNWFEDELPSIRWFLPYNTSLYAGCPIICKGTDHENICALPLCPGIAYSIEHGAPELGPLAKRMSFELKQSPDERTRPCNEFVRLLDVIKLIHLHHNNTLFEREVDIEGALRDTHEPTFDDVLQFVETFQQKQWRGEQDHTAGWLLRRMFLPEDLEQLLVFDKRRKHLYQKDPPMDKEKQAQWMEQRLRDVSKAPMLGIIPGAYAGTVIMHELWGKYAKAAAQQRESGL